MDRELKKKWTDALRSGAYRQGKNYLYNTRTGSYCCLGVLCEVLRPDNWDGAHLSGNSAGFTRNQWAEVSGAEPSMQEKLQVMNDFDEASFTQIANFIDEHIPEAEA